MVSKARDDLPEPLNPVMTTNLSRGMERLRFFQIMLARAANPDEFLGHTPLVGNQTQRERRSLHRIEENPSRVHFGPISFRPAFEQIGRLAHHHIGTVSFLPPPTEDQFPKPVPVRPPDLVQPDFLRHTLGPSAAKSLNSF
jgi:hypothetical protein